MNELTRYRIDLGKHVLFDENTIFNIDNDEGVSYFPRDVGLLPAHLIFEESEPNSNTFIIKPPTIINVTPNQKINIYGIILTAPPDATKMAKWSSDSIKSALVYFLKSDTETVDNAFAYQICMDNSIELEVPEELPYVS